MLSQSSPAGRKVSEEDSSGSDEGSVVSLEPETDRFGFIVTNGSAAGSVGPSPVVVRQREAKWINIMEQWDRILVKKSRKVKVQCQKGIPASLRAKCWPLLSGATERMKRTDKLYKFLDSQPGSQTWVDVIERDLDRQFPFHEMFLSKDGHGQRGLFRVLKAYTQYQPEEGYCQAQGPVAAVLLMNMPAEEAFWCLVQISEQYLPGYYNPLLEGVLFDAALLTWVLKKTCPAAHKHLQHHGVEPLMFATDWLMCLFTRHLPFNTLLRVWDLFFCYGVRVLLQVAVVLVRRVLGRPEQRKQCQGQMETLERLRGIKDQIEEEADDFISEVCSVPLSAKDLHKQVEKELQQWRKDRPSSTFDPRGRCQGYQMAWAKIQLYQEERDRRERETGNLSVPLARSASTLSLSPSLFHQRWGKGGKLNTSEGDRSKKVVRHRSMGAREDWRSWTDPSFKKVQGLKEEDEDASEGQTKSGSKPTRENQQREILNESETMDKTENKPSDTLIETVETKEQAEKVEIESRKEDVFLDKKEETNTPPTKDQLEETNTPPTKDQLEEETNTPPTKDQLEEETNTPPTKDQLEEETNAPPTKDQLEETNAPPTKDQLEEETNTPPTKDQLEEETNTPPTKDQLEEETNTPPTKDQLEEETNTPPTKDHLEETNTPPTKDQLEEETNTPPTKDQLEEETNTPPTKDQLEEETNTPPTKDHLEENHLQVTEERVKLNTVSQPEVLDEQSKEHENQIDAKDTNEERENEVLENEATVEDSETVKEDEEEENAEVVIIQSVTPTEEQMTPADMKPQENVETENRPQMQVDSATEESQPDGGVTVSIDEDEKPSAETETQVDQEEVIVDTEGDASERKYHSSESFEEPEEAESHTQTKAETDELAQTQQQTQENAALQDELIAEKIDSEGETETEEESLRPSSPEKEDFQVDTEIKDRLPDTVKETNEAEDCNLTQEEEKHILTVHSDVLADSNGFNSDQTDTKGTTETQDSVKPEEMEQTSTQTQRMEAELTQIDTSEPQAHTQPTSQVNLGPVMEEESTKKEPESPAVHDNTLTSPEPAAEPHPDSYAPVSETVPDRTGDQSERSSSSAALTSAQRSSRSSGDFCVRKPPNSRGAKLTRRLSEDLFTSPQKTSQSQIGANPTETQTTSEAANTTQPAPDVTLSVKVSEDIKAPKEPQPNPSKRLGLIDRLRGKQPKSAKTKNTSKLQVPKILIQDFSDMTGVEDEGEKKLSSKERRKIRRERERKEKEEERLKKKRDKELEKERRKPQTRGKSFQVQKEKDKVEITDKTKTGSKTLKYSASFTESYF